MHRARLLFVALLVGCDPPPVAERGSVCDQAKLVVESCGASLPLVSQRACIGIARAVSTCIAEHVANCDDLATLAGRIDQCVADAADGGDFAPAEDVPVPPADDAGADAAARDAGSEARDAPPPPVDAAIDAEVSAPEAGAPDAAPDVSASTGAVSTGLDVTRTVALGVEDRYTTPLLAPGEYTFAITGTGDADLYVKEGSIPKTNTYDCRPYLLGSDETCHMTLTAPGVFYVMVRGDSESSTYTLTGTP